MGGGRRVLGVAVACGVVLAACQAEESGKLTATKQQAVETGGLPWAPASNLTTQKVAQEPLSNHYVLIPKTAWETMRQSALVNGRATTNLRETRELAGDAASKANDVTSLGLYGALEVASSPQEPFLITADDVLVVAEDASVTTLGETTVVLASNLFIAGEGLVGSTPWRARGLNIALQDSPMGGGGRCCGPGLAGEPNPVDDVPGCTNGPNALCDSNIWVGVGASGGQAALRESAGLPPVQLMLLSGPELTTVRLDMAAPLGGMGPFACTQVRPECSVETGGPPPFGGWEAELPRGNPTCTPSGSVSGRRVPGSCQAAAESTMGYGVGGTPVVVRRAGGAPAGPECDGRCPECTSLEAVANTGLVPRQCWVRSTSGGGDICSVDTLGKVVALQESLENIIDSHVNTASCGDLSDPTATCGDCQAYPGDVRETCVRCSRAGGTASTCSYFSRYMSNGATPITVIGPDERTVSPIAGGPSQTLEPYTPPYSPCTIGCEKPRSGPRMPSSAPRAGGVAHGPGDAPANLPGATPQSNPAGGPISDPGTAAATSGHQGTAGDPVSLLSGALLLSSTDLSFPGPRRGLSFTRFYDSKTNTRGVLGSNWSHSYEVRVIPLRQENLPSWVDPYCAGTASIITCAMVVSGEVNRLYILDQATGLFLPQAGSMATLRKLDERDLPVEVSTLPHTEKVGWALRQPDGQVQFFDRLGYLVRDQDRFGNGLSFVHEKTAAGILAEAVCPLMPYLMSNGLWTAQVGPSGVPSNHVGCALLYGLTGFADLPQFSAGTAVTVEMFPLATTDATVTAARTKVLDSQAAGYGSPLPTGPAHKRLKRVTDDLGRSLEFVYASAGLDEGLLTQVTGPAGAAVAFRYAHPSQPAGLNEAYLIETERLDGPTGSAELVAAPGRGYSYEYAWQRPGEQLPTDLSNAETAYREYFNNIYNCGYATKTSCGGLFGSGVMVADTEKMVAEQSRRLYAEAADNIITVTARNWDASASRIEVETRYARNVYDADFDEVRFQRYGAVAHPSLPVVTPPSGALGYSWLSSLPFAAFTSQGAEPQYSTSLSDATSAFLPAALAQRYPMEATPPEALSGAYGKGMLLPRQAQGWLNYPGLGARPPLLAIGEAQISLAKRTVRKPCGIHRLPELRTRLPGYKPQVDYFDAQLPTQNLATEGVAWDTQLRRSSLSCETLALAQTYDVRHNDLATDFREAVPGDPNTQFVVETLIGRRKHTAANANRICRWVKFVDRDGDTHLTGLNYMGRPLVEALSMGWSWKVAETLYNADGNVIAQRRTTDAPGAWTPQAGETRYVYQEEPIAPGSLGTTRPMHWNKRGNVVRVEHRAAGGSVQDEVPGTSTLVASLGRYTAYRYEPFFNQRKLMERGALASSGADEPLERTTTAFDYEESAQGAAGLTELLREAQFWGADFATTSGVLQLPASAGVHLFDEDLNADGRKDGAAALPVRVTREAGANWGQREFSFLSWNASGQPTSLLSADGLEVAFSYYERQSPQSGAADSEPGGAVGPEYAGFLASVTQTRRAPTYQVPKDGQWVSACEGLGPWGFLATKCGAAFDDLVAAGLPATAAQVIADALQGATSSFNYNEAGHRSAVRGPDGVRTHVVTDLDGRVRTSALYAAGASTWTNFIEESHDAFMRRTLTRRFDAQQQSLGETVRTWDTDDKLLSECDESVPGGCNGTDATRSWVYTREGGVFRVTDAAGVVTQYVRDSRKWVTYEESTSPDKAEGYRSLETSYDNDGRVVARSWGGKNEKAGEATPLTESIAYDGLGRLWSRTDTEGRAWQYRFTKHDTRSSVTLVGDAAGPTRYSHDGFGRLLSATKNGLVLAAYTRAPGGLVYAETGSGRGTSWRTYDALGRVAWSQDAAGSQAISAEAFVPQRVVMSTLVRAGATPLITSTFSMLDEHGLPVSVMEEGGRLTRTTTYQRDATGLPRHIEAPDTAVTEVDWDFHGRPTEVRRQRVRGASDFEVSRFTYTAAGQLFTEVDPNGYETVHHYTGFGQPKYQSGPASTPQESTWEYDGLGRKRRHRSTNGVVDLGYRYDAVGRLEQLVRGDPENASSVVLASYGYDALGRLTEATRSNHGLAGLVPVEAERRVHLTRSYDDVALRMTETTEVGLEPARAVESQWELQNGQTWTRAVTLPSGRQQRQALNAVGQTATVERASGGLTTLTWLGELLHQQSHDTGLARSISYDELAQPLAWHDSAGGSEVMHVEVRRDVMGRIASSSFRAATHGGQVEHWRGYVYDVLGRVAAAHEASTTPSALPAGHEQPAVLGPQVDVAGSAVNSTRWGYLREEAVGSVIAISDAQGRNRFQASGSHTTPNGKWSARAPGYRLGGFDVGQVGRSMSHDEAGRVESDGHQDYVFDDEGLLAEVKGGAQEGYLYDALGRLVGKVRADGQLAEALVHDGAQLVEAWRSGSLAWTATWGPGLDNLVSIIDEQADEYLTLDDGKGSVIAWVKAGEKEATTWAEYTVEGRATYHHEKAGTTCVEEDDVRCDKPFDVPFGFHSAYGSRTTGLLYFRNRWYSPESGEWLSQDPLGNVDSDNLYAFNGFDPVNFVDPWGLEMGGVAESRELETGAKFFDQKPKVNTDGLLELIAQEETTSLLRQMDLNGGAASWAAMAPGAAQGTGWSGVRGGVSQLTLAYSGVDATLAKPPVPPPPVRTPRGLRRANPLLLACVMAESCRRMLEMPLSEIVNEIRDAVQREFLQSSRGMRSMPTPPFPRASAGTDGKPPTGPSETAGSPEPAKPEAPAPAPEPQADGAGALVPPNQQERSGEGAGGGLGVQVRRVVNSNMPHAANRAVERAGYSSVKDARTALQEFGAGIETNGLPLGTILDPAHADRVIVPGFGEGGAVVYQVKDGTLKLKTVLQWRSPQ